ncbi:MAG: BREX-2 system phosphatase PglZ, partial [Gammaproteobacteria bacterium]|nr:BREX-2 system phosphatase PglZ [Gammaproteobacteria bacterium]
MVTNLGLRELGADVEARLLRHRLFQVEPWDLLRTRFNARSFDASLNGKDALAKAAVEALGASSPDPAPAGVLTAEAAWKVVLERKLGVPEARPDARALLEWAMNADDVARWRAFPPELKSLFEDWLNGYLGDWVDPFLGCLDAGYGQSAIAIGFVLGVLQHQPTDAKERVSLAQALGRLERFVGGKALSTRAQRIWSDASEQWAGAVAPMGRFADAAPVLTDAEGILDTTGAGKFCHLSRWLPRGFQTRLLAAAQATSGDLAGVEGTLSDLEGHAIWQWAKTEREWLDRAQMAARLTRWLKTPEAQTADWPATVLEYHRSGAWVDVARQTVLTGDGPEPVLKAWVALLGRVTSRRERENFMFARALVEASQRNSIADAGVPVELVLERVVAPWGKERVLLIVMDGMTHAVWRELQCDVEGRNWVSWSWFENSPLPQAIAALPSITSVSRCSLLCGRLVVGGQDVEKRGFADNAALGAVSKSSYPPVLFHKDEVGAGASNLSDSVRKEIR